MINTILSALLPMVVTFLLGYGAAWHRDFGPTDAPILNRMVLLYAVPLSLFAGTVSTPRAVLSQDIPLVVALCVAIIGLYGVVYLMARRAFHMEVGTSALGALTASAPAVPFVGPAVLGDLFGTRSAVPIAIASLVINLTVVPATLLLLALKTTSDPTSPGSGRAVFTATLLKTIKEPIVWAPALAFVIVLCGVHIPQVLVHSLSMLGYAAGGVALFASGIVLAAGTITINWRVVLLVVLKNIVQPALVLGGLRGYGYSNPIVSQAVLTTAIPTMPIVIMFAAEYHVRQSEAASAVFLSVISSIVTMGAFIALTS
jgi:malonate transporter and related proteins